MKILKKNSFITLLAFLKLLGFVLSNHIFDDAAFDQPMEYEAGQMNWDQPTENSAAEVDFQADHGDLDWAIDQKDTEVGADNLNLSPEDAEAYANRADDDPSERNGGVLPPPSSSTDAPTTPKPETPKPETPKPETPKPETPKPETPKPETPPPPTTTPPPPATTPPPPATTVAPTNAASNNGAIIGGAVGGIAAVGAIAAAGVYPVVRKRNKIKKQKKQKDKFNTTESNNNATIDYSAMDLSISSVSPIISKPESALSSYAIDSMTASCDSECESDKLDKILSMKSADELSDITSQLPHPKLDLDQSLVGTKDSLISSANLSDQSQSSEQSLLSTSGSARAGNKKHRPLKSTHKLSTLSSSTNSASNSASTSDSASVSDSVSTSASSSKQSDLLSLSVSPSSSRRRSRPNKRSQSLLSSLSSESILLPSLDKTSIGSQNSDLSLDSFMSSGTNPVSSGRKKPVSRKRRTDTAVEESGDPLAEVVFNSDESAQNSISQLSRNSDQSLNLLSEDSLSSEYISTKPSTLRQNELDALDSASQSIELPPLKRTRRRRRPNLSATSMQSASDSLSMESSGTDLLANIFPSASGADLESISKEEPIRKKRSERQ